MDQNSAPDSRIELNLESGADASASRRQRPMVESVAYERPKLEPVLKDGDLGSDETERMVGFILLISMLPNLLAVLIGQGAGSLSGVGLPLALAYGLITGSEWARAYMFWVCLIQLVLAPALAFTGKASVPNHVALSVLSTVLRSGGILPLVSGRSQSRPFYFAALSAIGLGVLLGVVGLFL